MPKYQYILTKEDYISLIRTLAFIQGMADASDDLGTINDMATAQLDHLDKLEPQEVKE